MFKGLCAAVFLVGSASSLVVGCSSNDATPPAGGNGNAGSTGSAGSSNGSGSGGSAASSTGAGGSAGSGGSGGPGGSTGTGGSTGAGGSIAGPDAAPDATIGDAGDAGGELTEGGGNGSCAGYQLCDDFEGVAPGATGSAWTMIKSGGYVIETVTTQAHSGTHSVHAMQTAGSGYAYISETKTFPSTDFWGRAFLRIQSPSGGHQVFAGADTNMNEATGEQVRFLNNIGSGKISTNRRSDDKTKQSTTSIPMGSWFCYEWHETPTQLHIYLDGTELTDVGETWDEPTFVALVLGIERFSGGATGDVWIDDVAINSAQVGCK